MEKKVLRGPNPDIIAEKLYKISFEIDGYEEGLRTLKDKRERLKEEMLGAFRHYKMASVVTKHGVTYRRSFRASLAVSDPKKALAWATENRCVKVDTTKAASLLKGTGALPEGFEQKETEFISSSGMKGVLEEY